MKKVFLKIWQNLQENKRARVSLLKKRLWRRCFFVNFVKFLGTTFYSTPLDDCFCPKHKFTEYFVL